MGFFERILAGVDNTRLKFGFSGANLSTNVDSYAEVVSVVKYGEGLGFDSAWVSDRIRDAYVTLGACALATSKIRLCTGIVSSYGRHPVSNARSIATLDEICNGRQAIALGVGNLRAARQLGYEMGNGSDRVREMCILTKKLLAGESVTFEGRHFKVSGVKIGLKSRGDIPIYIAGSGPKIMEVAGEVADGAIIPFSNPEVIDRVKERIQEGAKKGGRVSEAISLVSWLPTHITDEKERVLDSLRGFAAMQLVLSPFDWVRSMGISEEVYREIKDRFSRPALGDPKLDSASWDSAKDYISDEIVDAFSLVGNSEEIISKIEGLEDCGFREFSLWIPFVSLPEKKSVLETFAKEVISRLG